MYQKVLIAYDGSEGSKSALRRAAILTNLYQATLTMAWVRSPLPHHALSLNQETEEADAADEYFDALKDEAHEIVGTRCPSFESVLLYGDAAREIVHFAEHKKFDLIVCGQTGHSGFVSRMLGHTADRISETANCDVLIVHRNGM
jgi:nucleotide-binding universal stress UspA family protein